jgi:Ala-tRNA(Pro) deacylase
MIKTDVHQQLRALLDESQASYRVIEHEPEGRTEIIARIRGNRIEQSIKSMVLQVRLTRKENIYCLANIISRRIVWPLPSVRKQKS